MTKQGMSPWSDCQEFNTVFNCIYQSIDSTDFDYELLLFAKNKITIWLTRMQCNIDTNVNLMATKEIINALIEDKSAEEAKDESAVYSLYALSVIRFCTAISQYSHENNMKSVKRLAHRYSCPQWIIDCRHKLCHSSANQPSIAELRTAAMIGLNWLKQYFWIKILDKLNLKFNNNRNYLELIQRFITNDKQIKKKTKNEIIFAIKYFRNEFISALIQILIDLNESETNINFNSLKIPKLYLRKFSNIFAIIINYNSLSIVLNLIVKYFDCENQTKQHLAMSWFSTLVKSIESENKISKFKRNFKSLTFDTVMSEIEWIRLLYSLTKRPNPYTSILIQLIAPIVSDVISEDKIKILIDLSNLYSSKPSNEDLDSENNSDGQEFTPKSVKDLINTNKLMHDFSPDISDSIDWSLISFGASISLPSNSNSDLMEISL